MSESKKRRKPQWGLWWFSVVLLYAFLCWSGHAPTVQDLYAQFRPDKAQEFWVEVLYVNDGDTITVDYEGSSVLVRFLGIEAPETRHSTKLYRAAKENMHSPQQEAELGEKARSFLLDLLPVHNSVRLEFESDSMIKDRYGRLLAYVYLEDGRMLNEIMVSQGQARVYRYTPCQLTPHLRELEKQARTAQIGFWGLGGNEP